MRFLHLLSWAASTAWAMEPVKAQAILGVLLGRAFGEKSAYYDPEDEREERRREQRAAAERQAQADRGGIAIIPLTGVIAPRIHDVSGSSTGPSTSAEGFARQIRALAADSSVSGIIIDVDSPGGNVQGITEAWQAIRDAGQAKQVVAISNHWMASAAYWLASAASEIVVTPSGEAGSIGVYAYHEDISAAMAAAGVKPTLVKSSSADFKAEGHPAFPLSEEAVAYMQASVDESTAMFHRDIAKGRSVSVSTVRDNFGRGRMFSAKEAVSLGMADRVGTLDEEIARMQRGLRARSKAATSDRRRRLAVA